MINIGKILISLLLMSKAVAGDSVSNSTVLTFRVPVVVKLNVTRLTDTEYLIQEISNNPRGYTVTLQTDAFSVRYDNQNFNVINGSVVLTNVLHQDVSINVFKPLIFNQSYTTSNIVISYVGD